jgi:hypothetical protein
VLEIVKLGPPAVEFLFTPDTPESKVSVSLIGKNKKTQTLLNSILQGARMPQATSLKLRGFLFEAQKASCNFKETSDPWEARLFFFGSTVHIRNQQKLVAHIVHVIGDVLRQKPMFMSVY